MKNLHLSSSMTIYFFYFFSFLNSKVFMWNFTYSFILSQWQKLLVFSPKSVSPSFFIDSDFLQGSGMPKVRHISQPVRYLEVAIWHSSDRHGSLWGECPHDKKDKMLKKEACLALPLPFFSFFFNLIKSPLPFINQKIKQILTTTAVQRKRGSRKWGISFLQTPIILKFSTQDDFTSKGHLATCGESPACHNRVGEWVGCAEAKGATKHPTNTMHQTPHTHATKTYEPQMPTAPKLRNPELEDPLLASPTPSFFGPRKQAWCLRYSNDLRSIGNHQHERWSLIPCSNA